MGRLKLESDLVNSNNKQVKTHVIDYVWDQVKGKRGFKTYDYNKLNGETYKYVSEPPMMST